MTTIIPRWEWRTFGESFGVADVRFAELPVEKVQESDETYLLSPVTDANVKVRDALMDIKTFEETGAGGLERWRPVMKATFPLGAAEVARVCEALGVRAPVSLERPATLEGLTAALTGTGVRAAAVHKRRVRYTMGGCMSEVTEVVADGRSVRTVAIESEEADAVTAAVRAMGLEGHPNVSYPKGLKALLGIQAREG